MKNTQNAKKTDPSSTDVAAVKKRILRELNGAFPQAEHLEILWDNREIHKIKDGADFVQMIALGKKKYNMRIRFEKGTLSELSFPGTNIHPPIRLVDTAKASPSVRFIWNSDPEQMLDELFGFKRQPLPEELTIDPALGIWEE